MSRVQLKELHASVGHSHRILVEPTCLSSPFVHQPSAIRLLKTSVLALIVVSPSVRRIQKNSITASVAKWLCLLTSFSHISQTPHHTLLSPPPPPHSTFFRPPLFEITQKLPNDLVAWSRVTSLGALQQQLLPTYSTKHFCG